MPCSVYSKCSFVESTLLMFVFSQTTIWFLRRHIECTFSKFYKCIFWKHVLLEQIPGSSFNCFSESFKLAYLIAIRWYKVTFFGPLEIISLIIHWFNSGSTKLCMVAYVVGFPYVINRHFSKAAVNNGGYCISQWLTFEDFSHEWTQKRLCLTAD